MSKNPDDFHPNPDLPDPHDLLAEWVRIQKQQSAIVGILIKNFMPLPNPCSLSNLCKYVQKDVEWTDWVEKRLDTLDDRLHKMCEALQQGKDPAELECPGGSDTAGTPPKKKWPPEG